MAYGGGYTSRSGLNARPQPSDQLQINIGPQFNYDSQLQDLTDDVKRIKQLAYAIDDERKLHGAEINTLEEYMEKAQAMLKQAGRRLTLVSRQSRSWLLLWVVLFGIALFFIVFMLKKLHRLGRWLV
ncbi:MAG: Qc-snare protein, SFT1 family [Monoraphidium minutum]|nr:MAG: Qc-snare protein, SFT1 family [Monoraphidium minutum]